MHLCAYSSSSPPTTHTHTKGSYRYIRIFTHTHTHTHTHTEGERGRLVSSQKDLNLNPSNSNTTLRHSNARFTPLKLIYIILSIYKSKFKFLNTFCPSIKWGKHAYTIHINIHIQYTRARTHIHIISIPQPPAERTLSSGKTTWSQF